MNRALHQSVPLEAAQSLGQHFLRDASNLPLQGGLTQRPPGQNLNDQRRPFIGDPVENEPGGAL